MKVIYEDDTERAEFEAYYKGYRNDIIVEIDQQRYQIYVTTMTRLAQDYEEETKNGGFYLVEPNIVIVDEVTKNRIEKTVEFLIRCHYFEHIKEL